MENLLKSFSTTTAMVRRNGLLFTSKRILRKIHREFHEWRFDRKWNVSTREFVVHPAESADPLHREAEDYQPTTPMLFREIMQATRHLSLPETFFDMGCGKGRVLLMASLYGFKRIVGVEFDPHLSEAARTNIDRFKARQKSPAEFEVHCQDAGSYSFPDVNSVIFLFNPFKEKIMVNTLNNIRRSAFMTRERYIIYHNPVFESLMNDRNEFVLLVKEKYFAVYRMVF